MPFLLPMLLRREEKRRSRVKAVSRAYRFK